MFTLLLLLTSTIVCEEMVKIRWRDPSDMDIGLKQENSSVTVHCNVPLKKAKLGPRWVSDTFCSFTGPMLCDAKSKNGYVTVDGCMGEDTAIALVGDYVPGGAGDFLLQKDGSVIDLTGDAGGWGVGVNNGSAVLLDDMAGQRRFVGVSDIESHRQHISRFADTPKKLSIAIIACYDVSLLRKFRGNVKQVEHFVVSTVTYGQHNFRHPTLGTEISITVEDVCFINSTVWAESKELERLSKSGSKTPTIVFSHDSANRISNTIGIAYRGALCRRDGKAVGIVEIQESKSTVYQTAKVFSHEFAHLCGIQHDMNHFGRDCYGIMSYGNERPAQWSNCNREDFRTWYAEGGSGCLKDEDEPEPSSLMVIPLSPVEKYIGYCRVSRKDVWNWEFCPTFVACPENCCGPVCWNLLGKYPHPWFRGGAQWYGGQWKRRVENGTIQVWEEGYYKRYTGNTHEWIPAAWKNTDDLLWPGFGWEDYYGYDYWENTHLTNERVKV